MFLFETKKVRRLSRYKIAEALKEMFTENNLWKEILLTVYFIKKIEF